MSIHGVKSSLPAEAWTLTTLPVRAIMRDPNSVGASIPLMSSGSRELAAVGRA